MAFEGMKRMVNMVRPKGADDIAAKIVIDSIQDQNAAAEKRLTHGERTFATEIDHGNYDQGRKLLESGSLSEETRQQLEQELASMRDSLSFDNPGAVDRELIAEARAAIDDTKRYSGDR